MKKLFAFYLVVSSLSIFANEVPRFSAFSDGKFLHITIMADTCNTYGASLGVASNCKKSRMIENYASTCAADLRIVSTRMMCSDFKLVPKVLSLELAKTEVAYEATTLLLRRGGATIEVGLDGDN